ncbi:hypothetical protein Sros_7769 [Streptosporangium roseum DSM 43021]|uniref:Uncharacterized protein n=1 Tax=Streptosporangium roseum (strain ATCC 12428 / DSM 43021 / JCM 3005 / KCTC 9067 / NCIMB 10171 / NRRL 2505 / NI 9100) TaxID=479432 RepID=D2ASV8_STRRD|nr:hypothetical protein Sros_7769 [Streptosporangium roseum DSM 43021]
MLPNDDVARIDDPGHELRRLPRLGVVRSRSLD